MSVSGVRFNIKKIKKKSVSNVYNSRGTVPDQLLVKSINDLVDNIKEVNKSVDARVSVLESEVGRIDKAVLNLTKLVADVSENTHKILKEHESGRKQTENAIFGKIDILSDKLASSSKIDWNTIIAAASFFVMTMAAIWGLAIAPINNKLAIYDKSFEKVEATSQTLYNKINEHEKLPFHSVAENEFKRLRADVDKLLP